MALSNSAVTIGVWTDYSRNGALAKTLTLSNRDAVALLAFLATLVGIVGVRSWRITRFILFIVFAPKSAPQGDLSDRGTETTVLPQHVILRNSETATGAAIGLLSCGFLKGNPTAAKNQHRLGTTLLSVLALGHGMTFIALSILTSQIVLGRTVVSKPTSTCGIWRPFHNRSDENFFEYHQELKLDATLDADNYVQNCYFGSGKSGIFNCQSLMSQSIPFSVSEKAGCPFANDVCRTNTSFVLDTGNVSISQLGINTKLADQLYFRRQSICAPIREEPFFFRNLTSDDVPWLKEGEVDTQYLFDIGQEDETILHGVRNSYQSTSYDLTAYLGAIDDSLKTEPRTAPLRVSEELYRGRHGLSLVLLSGSGITFSEESDDPVWSVHTKVERPRGTPWTKPLNIIGCDERFQICAKFNNRCLPWSGLFPKYNTTELDEKAADDKHASLNINITLSIVIEMVDETSIPSSIAHRAGSSALRATRTMNDGFQFRLEPEQWKMELKYWFAVAMSRLQLNVYKTAEKPEGLDPNRSRNLLADVPFIEVLCGSIKFVSSNHTSLSFVGVVVIVVVSASLLFLSFFEVLISLVPSKWHGRWASQWESSENLALLEGKKSLENESVST
ncbi:hypothetical protein EDB81DRAFT_756199 [Dactylonectria macrodidyma]|uniref:Uncharacterized protein n=1 Tax=Dactylonectria macrodidyma TaxID=307937 RepID=A0A9P9FIJ1_9HYPO|nr:hypothetical protein EDB81DRAFT_756199 [Dactylonectria macrodidyma]